MPFIRITSFGSPLRQEQITRLQQETTRFMVEILHKDPSLTAVLVEEAKGSWSIGGAPQPLAAHVEAIITKGTNSTLDKAAFLAAQRDLLHEVLGALPKASYIVIREIEGTDWGYDGLSQLERKQRREAL
jgi:4-oxalocrotonate tautomerase